MFLLAFAAVVLTILFVHVVMPRDTISQVAASDAQTGSNVERGTDHNDATAAEVLAVFDELAAQVYFRVVAFEDDLEVPLPSRRIEGPQRASELSPWSTPPVRPLVLVRWPVTS